MRRFTLTLQTNYGESWRISFLRKPDEEISDFLATLSDGAGARWTGALTPTREGRIVQIGLSEVLPWGS